MDVVLPVFRQSHPRSSRALGLREEARKEVISMSLCSFLPFLSACGASTIFVVVSGAATGAAIGVVCGVVEFLRGR